MPATENPQAVKYINFGQNLRGDAQRDSYIHFLLRRACNQRTGELNQQLNGREKAIQRRVVFSPSLMQLNAISPSQARQTASAEPG
jgi:hypothetical protein